MFVFINVTSNETLSRIGTGALASFTALTAIAAIISQSAIRCCKITTIGRGLRVVCRSRRSNQTGLATGSTGSANSAFGTMSAGTRISHL